MNRLLTRKKTRDSADDEYTPTGHSGSMPGQSPAKKKTGWRKKKGKQEPEPEVDIRAVLPSADEFRTSLIMPNLSTRFSMLKEQDDPKSKLGKASDDSVISLRRHDPLLGDGAQYASGLSDIAEVSSLTSSTRTKQPSIPQRNGSYANGDGYATDDDSSHSGSIMNRARPGEGNMLFGGRQKIYRIPVGDSGAVQSLGTSERRGMRGRALYEDDVSQSAFQRLREEEKEIMRLEKETETYQMGKDDPNSPALSNSEKRETSSSTNSGRSMMGGSTAPTSVGASSPPFPLTTAAQANYPPSSERAKSRKLYEQGLEQHIQEQHSVALGRVPSVGRNLPSSGSTPIKARSTSNMHDRFEATAQPARRTGSPVPIFQNPGSQNPPMRRPSYEQSSPAPGTSIQEGTSVEKKNALWEAMDPQDRGMATAMGTFNRPKKFDEQQFLQRQMSLLKQQPNTRSENESFRAPPPSAPAHQKFDETRSRAAPPGTDRSLPEASSRRENAAPYAPPKRPVKRSEMPGNRDPRVQNGPSRGTFLISPEPNDDVLRNNNINAKVQENPNRAPRNDVPTASKRRAAPEPIEASRAQEHRISSESSTASPNRNKDKRRGWSPDELQTGLAAAGGPHKEYLARTDTSTNASEPVAKQSSNEESHNIQGLVQEHLRQQSNSSSIYPAPTPGPEQTTFHTYTPSGYDLKNPWEADETPLAEGNDLNESFGMETDPEYDGPMHAPGSSTQQLHGLGVQETQESVPDWEQELNKQHLRGASTDTAHERQAFATELAERQRAIQENLKVKSGHNSPSPTSTNAKNAFESGLKGFGMLRGRQSSDVMPSPDRDMGHGPSVNGERPQPRVRGSGEGALAPPTMGRTLHSRMPRDDYEGAGDYQSEYGRAPRPPFDGQSEYGRAPRPPFDGPRPSLDGDGMRQGYRPSPQNSRPPPPRKLISETARPPIKPRSNSEAAGASQTRRAKNMNGPVAPRPSIENVRARSDSNPGKSLVNESKARSERFAADNNSQNVTAHTEPPTEPKASTDYSESASPPLTADSTSNIASSATSASMSLNAPAIVVQREQDHTANTYLPPAPVTRGSFDIPPPAPPSRTKTEPVGSGVTRGQSVARPGRKNTISKHDISEPKLINSTSAVNTMELPVGASLQNGLRNDFDVVLMGPNSTAAAPSPNIPTGDKPRKPGFLRQFSRKEKTHPEVVIQAPEDEPEPRRFAIKRLENQEGNGGGKPTHLAALQEPGNTMSMMSTISTASMAEYGRGIL